MMTETWEAFRGTGLLWFVNTTLHLFGWAIVLEEVTDGPNAGEVVRAYPARVNYRGFSETSNAKGYEAVSRYLSRHVHELYAEASDAAVEKLDD